MTATITVQVHVTEAADGIRLHAPSIAVDVTEKTHAEAVHAFVQAASEHADYQRYRFEFEEWGMAET